VAVGSFGESLGIFEHIARMHPDSMFVSGVRVVPPQQPSEREAEMLHVTAQVADLRGGGHIDLPQ